ncbi:hypothetical protein FHX82_007058 [Amycolatopsis bartoniae]|uniref:Uncharacterized protein n=1 Tax=Amycolatopsis bartoniae TaxID=941986 RepID=A0A8H9IMV6_9PSEU|nr:hypothetical protein [Amycolatopsis bartoniae]MBB2939972.1 hypothetical protein [Amycolatopsis bartoniae]TVT10144.1 hypothetical protein FNH07_06075 [Amycolatopsis bartoniae]GHF35393.1 hypothetical protein GCM10017566_05220 [Amycolatopsis bartoniae]
MPKDAAHDREDECLKLVCAALSNPSRSLAIEDRPDRAGQVRDLTVDALIRVIEDGYDAAWAADVCLASRSFDPKLPAAMNQLREILLPPLSDLAARAGHHVSLSCRAYVRLPGVSRNEWRRMLNGYVRNVYDRAVMALVRPDKEWYDHEVGIYWHPDSSDFDVEPVRLQFYDPFRMEGFRFSRAVPLKLTKQLKRAHDAGYPTLLILDQKPPSYVTWLSNTCPDPHELGEAMAFLVGRHRASLSACVLVDHDDSVHEIYRHVRKTINVLAH